MDIYVNQNLCEYTLECLDGELKHNGRTRRVYEVERWPRSYADNISSHKNVSILMETDKISIQLGIIHYRDSK